jgi:[ribosomal protein S5]-alanine N-acetyltransferase
MNLRLETARLVVREFVESDWRAMHATHSREDVVRYLTIEPMDEAAAREYVQGIIVCARELPRTEWDLAITLRGGDDVMIGRVGMKRDADPRSAMLWFTLDPAHHGNGYATEAVRALLDHSFGEVRLHRVWGDCDPRNMGSGRVMERAGMRCEGKLIENVWIKGEWCDSVLYAVLAREWADVRGADPGR